MKKRLTLTVLFAAILCNCLNARANEPTNVIKAKPFSLTQVRLLDSPFKTAMEINKDYLLKLDADRMLWPYHERAGLPTKGERYGGWELKDIVGQTTGHYMSALSLMYASSGDRRFKERVDYIVSEIAKAQQKHGDGYTGPVRTEVWKNIFSGDLKAHKWGVGGGYVPWYVIHKTFAGLIDAYIQTDNKQALEVVIKLADWAKKGTDNLDEAQFQDMLRAEHGGMSESLAHLYAITGNKDYLALAQRFDHKEILDPLEKKEDKLAGYHVNTQLPKILSAARLYELTGDQRYRTAVNFLWDRVVNTRSMAPGGVDLREHFYEAGDESAHLAWNSSETCSVYNMLKLTRSVFSWNPSAATMDYYERALYNQILGSQDPDSGGMTYFYCLKPGHFKIYSTPFDAMWCCVGSGIENHSKYADTIYSHNDDTLWINLFIPSLLDWQEKDVTIRQETNFPDDDTMNFVIATKAAKKFTMEIRVPYWATGGVSVWVNGRKENVEAKPQSYLALSRIWQDGDTVKVQLPMSLHLHRARDDEDMAVIMYGPLTLAGELGKEGMPGDDVNANMGAHSGMMDPPVPRLLIGDNDLSSCVKRVEGDVLRFKTVGIGSPQDVTLVPLHAMHHQRYTVYWNTKAAEAGGIFETSRVSEAELEPGLEYKYYEGRWDNVPDFGTLKAAKTGVVENFDISGRMENNGFGFVFSGYLKIAKAGDYHFATISDDGSVMSLAGKEIVNNDGIHAMISKRSGPISLKAAFYPLEVRFFDRDAGKDLEVRLYDGGGEWRRIPQDMLFRRRGNKDDGDSVGSRSPIGDGHGEWIVPGDPAAEPNFVSGRIAKAVQLTGGGKSVRIRHYPQLKPREQITISAWIKPAEYNDQWRQIYRKEDGNARQLFALGRTGDTKGVWFGLGIGGGYHEYGGSVATDELMDDQWHLVAATYDGALQRIYFDGEEIGSREMSGPIDTDGSVSAYIGSWDGNQEFFSGGIDDVRIYSRALSPQEIKTMAGKNAGNDRSLVGWWTLDGNLNNTASGIAEEFRFKGRQGDSR